MTRRLAREIFRASSPGAARGGRLLERAQGADGMRYFTLTDIPPEEVLERARRFFAEHSRLRVREETDDSLVFAGEIGLARFSVDRHGGHTNVRVETDRVVGLDVTDLAKRFLYTLRSPG